jgi:hypothetical protein
MNYNASDHAVTFREVLAGWVLCLAMIGVAFTATGKHAPAPEARIDDPSYVAAATAPRPIRGVRIPRFALCAVPDAGAVKVRGPMSSPTNLCS